MQSVCVCVQERNCVCQLCMPIVYAHCVCLARGKECLLFRGLGFRVWMARVARCGSSCATRLMCGATPHLATYAQPRGTRDKGLQNSVRD
jgi:hypothetical protein